MDPCQLVTTDEAVKLAGTALSAGKEATDQNRKTCTYDGAGVVFTVIVVQAPDQATLDAGKAAFLADLQNQAGTDLSWSMVSGIGDAAAVATLKHTAGAITLNGVGIYVVKGLTFFAITDLGIGQPVASTAAIKAQATTTLGRIP